MSSRHFIGEEKGKGLALQTGVLAPKLIRAQEFDTSALIRDNALTFIGKVTNPRERPVGFLISALPRKWSLKGHVSGSDIG
ncbi:hypothetical protein YC2023_103325 [Brassica napus]